MMNRFRRFIVKTLDPTSGNSLKIHLAKESIGSFGLQIGSTGLGMLSGILLARLLKTDGYGAYTYAMSLIQLLTIPTVMGLPQLIMREVAAFQVRKAYGLMRGLLTLANQFVFLFSLLIALCAALIAVFFGSRLNPAALDTFLIALFLLPLLGLNNLRMAALRGLGHVVLGLMPEMLFRPVIFIVMVLGAFLILPQNLSPKWAMVFQVLATGLSFGAGVWILMRHLPKTLETVTAAYETRAWFKSALPFMMLGAMQIINNRTDIVMLGIFRTMAEVGVYSAVSHGASVVAFILLAVNMAIAPTIAALYAQKDMERLQRIVTYSARAILAGTLPVVLVLFVLGRWLLATFFGDDFGAGANALRILCLGQLFCAAMGSVGVILHMTGYERDAAKSVFVSVFINVILNFLLIPKFGINGAAVATAISLSVWYLLLAWLVYVRLGLYSNALGDPLKPASF